MGVSRQRVISKKFLFPTSWQKIVLYYTARRDYNRFGIICLRTLWNISSVFFRTAKSKINVSLHVKTKWNIMMWMNFFVWIFRMCTIMKINLYFFRIVGYSWKKWNNFCSIYFLLSISDKVRLIFLEHERMNESFIYPSLERSFSLNGTKLLLDTVGFYLRKYFSRGMRLVSAKL